MKLIGVTPVNIGDRLIVIKDCKIAGVHHYKGEIIVAKSVTERRGMLLVGFRSSSIEIRLSFGLGDNRLRHSYENEEYYEIR